VPLPAFGFCRLCEKQLEEGTPVCPHCGQKDPIDRFEDLEQGRVYEADYVGEVVEDLHWFRLKHSGRRVFAAVPAGEAAQSAFRAAGERSGGHRLECTGFEGRYAHFRYVGGMP
jgi:hypothetical protein